MHPHDCPEWEYKDHPHCDAVLPRRCNESLHRLRRHSKDSLHHAIQDTRAEHHEIFSGLAFNPYEYFAGHYRGEDYRCLRYYDVGVGADPMVGVPCSYVFAEMDVFRQVISELIAALDAAQHIPNAVLSAEQKLINLVRAACRVLVEFLRIHPYANGNGHIGRWLVIAFLHRYGFWPKKWPLNSHPPYDQMLFEYRRGDKDNLEVFVLQCCIS